MVSKGRRKSVGAARGSLGTLQKIAIASGLLEGDSTPEIARVSGQTQQAVRNAINDPYIGGLVGRLIASHELEIREAFGLMMYTIQRDLQATGDGAGPVVTAARKDLTRVMALSVQSERDAPADIGKQVQLVINLPASLPSAVSPIDHTSKR